MACERPPSSFSRDNSNDPGNISYVPEGPERTVVQYYSEEVIQIKWIDHSYTQEKYLLEKQINGGPFSVIREITATPDLDTVIALDTVSHFGEYTYRVQGHYPEHTIRSKKSNTLNLGNWLKVADKKFEGGDFVSLDSTRILAHSNEEAAIYSHQSLRWKEIDVSFCDRKLARTIRLKHGDIAALCTSPNLVKGEIGVFIFNISTEQWSLASKLKKKISDFDLYNDSPVLISLSDENILVVGFSFRNNYRFTIAELVDLKTQNSIVVDPDNHRVETHSTSPDPIGIELSRDSVFVSSGVGEDCNFIFNPIDNSWKSISSTYTEISDINLLKDGRVITIDGTNSGFGGGIYDPINDSWKLRGHSTYSGFARKLLKLPNGNVFSIDSGGNVYLFQVATDSWLALDNVSDPSFNFQYNSATVYRGNIIMVNNFHNKSSHIYRPSPEEEHYFN